MSEGKSCLVVGVGPGLGAAIGRRFAAAGYAVALAARTPGKVDSHIGEIEAAGGTRLFEATAILWIGQEPSHRKDTWSGPISPSRSLQDRGDAGPPAPRH